MDPKSMSLEDLIKKEKAGNRKGGAAGAQRGGRFGGNKFAGARQGGDFVPRIRQGGAFKQRREEGVAFPRRGGNQFGQGQRI